MRAARRWTSAAAGLLLVSLLTTLTLHPGEPALAASVTSPRPTQTVLTDCSGHLVTRPVEQILACADGSIAATHLHWTTWGGAAAVARGRFRSNTCSPSCAAGHDVSYPAVFRLDHRARIGATSRYRHIHIHLPGRAPAWLHGHDLDLDAPS